jgi:glycosyltransferase involved in cell wall biosynthesis
MSIELSIVMPCLNEAETLANCIRQAHEGAKLAGVESYEIIIADNGSGDGSQNIARAEGAVVVDVPIRGYGAALRAGIEIAQGKYVIMGDSDASYDFSNIKPFVNRLREDVQLVMGTRLKGEIQPGAMPFLHRYFGNPVLTRLANLLFKTRLSDYHCGMRGFDRKAILRLGLATEGMEFASEMVIRARLAGLSEAEVPITYQPDGRSRPPHLKTWHDGWRHLRFILLYSPRWLFLYPGIVLTILGFIISGVLLIGPLQIGDVTFDVHTLLFSATMFIGGVQLIFIAVFTRAYASRSGLLPKSPLLEQWLDRFSLGLGLVSGLALCLIGIALYVIGLAIWGGRSFGPLVDFKHTMRIVIGGTTLIILGIQVFFGSFVMSLLSLH